MSIAQQGPAIKEDYFVKHGEDDILFGEKRVRSPSGPESKQDLLTHVDICSSQVVDQLNDERIDLLNPKQHRVEI